ncbi:MAG TPA: hypothetical protein VGG39_31125 [Polyangiaceae bacterium]
MSLRDLLLLYAVVGLACAVAVLRRTPAMGVRAVGSAIATMVVWPLWAPFALGAAPPSHAASGSKTGVGARIDRALAEAVAAVAGTPMSDVFSPRVAARIGEQVSRVAAHMEELEALVARSGFDPQQSAERLRVLETAGAPERSVATARLQHDSLLRLQQLRAADAQALDELAGLLEALRAQLLLARYSGSSAEGAGAIVSEVWARLEGLGIAFGDGTGANVGGPRTGS